MADITYCGDSKCKAKECLRHPSRMTPGSVVAEAVFDCPYMPCDHFGGYVEVVYCKDCEMYENDRCKIRKDSWGAALTRGNHDYCSDGRRKERG